MREPVLNTASPEIAALIPRAARIGPSDWRRQPSAINADSEKKEAA